MFYTFQKRVSMSMFFKGCNVQKNLFNNNVELIEDIILWAGRRAFWPRGTSPTNLPASDDEMLTS